MIVGHHHRRSMEFNLKGQGLVSADNALAPHRDRDALPGLAVEQGDADIGIAPHRLIADPHDPVALLEAGRLGAAAIPEAQDRGALPVTPLIEAARKLGCGTSTGTEMYQALQKAMLDFLAFADEA